MRKHIYIQPSVDITEVHMVQTICESPAGGGYQLGGGLNPDAVTEEQL